MQQPTLMMTEGKLWVKLFGKVLKRLRCSMFRSMACMETEFNLILMFGCKKPMNRIEEPIKVTERDRIASRSNLAYPESSHASVSDELPVPNGRRGQNLVYRFSGQFLSA